METVNVALDDINQLAREICSETEYVPWGSQTLEKKNIYRVIANYVLTNFDRK